jgi:hypothetical protein
LLRRPVDAPERGSMVWGSASAFNDGPEGERRPTVTIRKSIKVERPPEISFKVFCEQIGRWWPKGPSFGGKILADMFIEARVGGRFYEVYDDGTEFEIGRVTTY